MKLFILSPPETHSDEVSILKELFTEGLKTYHLRKPEWAREEFIAFIEKIDPEHRDKIVLHSQFNLVDDLNLKGVHFPEKIRKEMVEKRIDTWMELRIEYALTLSTSVHSSQSLGELHPCFDYSFLGPVFDSISKPGYGPEKPFDINDFDPEGVLEVIGLGGIQPDNLHLVRDKGFHGAAMLGAIWNAPKKAVETFVKAQEKCQELGQ